VRIYEHQISAALTIRAGGFAHVYLVRTATPVYGTTHHVLKRIAVANEAMLTEVKKEVDIMVRNFIYPLIFQF
jgi:AP2-associated kinase